MVCPDCFAGYEKPEVDPKGYVTTLHGLQTYVVEPEGEVKGIIVMVPDAFGWVFANNRALCDNYAKKSQCRVYLPDFMQDTPVSVTILPLLNNILRKNSWWNTLWKPLYVAQAIYGMAPFIYYNRFGSSWPIVKSFFTSLRTHEAASLPIGAAGFCWGGKHIFNLAHGHLAPNSKPLVDAVYTAHPSNLAIPAEIEKVVKPVSLAMGTQDFALSVEKTKEIEKVLKGIEEREGVESEVVFYEGAGHGFAVRADPGNKEVGRMAVAAEDQAVEWFRKCFAKVAY
ncbi:dienelactone hydrolase family protein [Pseudovirgaria hyperparasitica]|uniref:Dienelactone hydrolase family protein n=1 Tax=Pseudovirgaria hyperparasitica TaxID=470096 RepID=A0A6A6VVD9_9PEZI|nr:dienelactone hydrolase family protein [Pseudovirgaria hyperparasitica]KAF2753211.1 dienelactone hydrolase family protein [Pseudovirgaria hyperparasitica]